MPETIFQSEPTSSEANRLRMMLRTWEAVSTERELPGVLASLADVLVTLVPFDSIGIIDFTVPNDTPDEDGDLHRLLALHVVGVAPVDGETPDQLAARSFLTPANKSLANSTASPTPATICSKKTVGFATNITWQKTASAPTPPFRPSCE